MQTVPAQELECHRAAALARHPNIKPGQEFTGYSLILRERACFPYCDHAGPCHHNLQPSVDHRLEQSMRRLAKHFQ